MSEIKTTPEAIYAGLSRIAEAITPNIPGSDDGYGTYVGCLTEAVASAAIALHSIASSLGELARAVEEIADKG